MKKLFLPCCVLHLRLLQHSYMKWTCHPSVVTLHPAGASSSGPILFSYLVLLKQWL